MNACQTYGCTRKPQRDSLWCQDCLRDRWMLRTPEWVLRAKAKQLPAVDMTAAR